MTDIKEHRAWVRAVTKLSTATSLMYDVAFLGIDPNIQAECGEIWNSMDSLKHRMLHRIEEMESELEEKLEGEL